MHKLNIKSFFAFLLLSYGFFGSLHAGNGAALVVIIDQQKFQGDPKPIITALNGLTPGTLQSFGTFGEILRMAKERLPSNTDLATLFDEVRLEWIKNENKKNGNKYDEIYPLLGEDARNTQLVKLTLREVLKTHDAVDLVFMVHRGNDVISYDPSFLKGKLRIVVNSACNSFDGGEDYVEKFKALASTGHGEPQGPPSASPVYNFDFLRAWFGGKSFEEAVNDSQEAGNRFLSDPVGFMFARLIEPSFPNPIAALVGSKIHMRLRRDVHPGSITIDSPVPGLKDSEVAAPRTVTPKAGSKSSWSCIACTYVNDALSNQCAMCENTREVTITTGSKAPKSPWPCPICTYENKAETAHCAICAYPWE